ncbi:hypothetical protein B0H17DRAFT_1140589 [Mycena rosella]|uniref:Uncharacterized protein n=1 Tax=Mycena rosella TaxID=1033263 RepID=A0AAD7D1H9_MYCRO|nr:hypothetical protein B0H17DRAFT_1140589 [Mycena rosella]
MGQHFQGLFYTRQAQECAEILGDAFTHGVALLIEGDMRSEYGDFQRAAQLYRQAQNTVPWTALYFGDIVSGCVALEKDRIPGWENIAGGGDLTSAKAVFQESLPSFLDDRPDIRALFRTDKLVDISHQMTNCVEELRWNGICVAWAVRTSNKLGTMNTLRRLIDLFSTAGDSDTTLSLLSVALDGFKRMGVHQRIAQCTVAMAATWESRGDFTQSIELLTGARPRFERSSQSKEIALVDAKLKSLEEVALVDAKLKSLLTGTGGDKRC